MHLSETHTLLNVGHNPILRTLTVDKNPTIEGTDSAAQRLIVASGDHNSQLTIVNAQTGAAVHTVAFDNDADAAAIDPLTHVAYVVGGQFINDNGIVSWLNLKTGQVMRTADVGIRPQAVAFDRLHGRIFVANYNDNTLTIVSRSSGAIIRTVNVGQSPSAIAVDEPANRVYVLSTTDNSLTMLEARSGRFIKLIPVAENAQQVDVLGPQQRLFTLFCPQSSSCGDETSDVHGALVVRDGKSGAVVPNASFASFGIAPMSMMYDNVDKQVVVFDAGANAAIFLDPRNGTFRRRVRLGNNVAGIVVLAHRRRIAALGLGVVNGYRKPLGDGELRLYDLHTGHLVGHIGVSQGTDGIAGDDLNDRVFLTNSNDRTLQTVDPALIR